MTLPRYRPMLATPWPQPFADPDWTFELKYDGVRTLLYWDGARVELRSRSDRDVTASYPELATFRAGPRCVLDGEVIALDEAGRPSFQRLQSRMNLARPGVETLHATPVSYVVFDVLFHDGDVTGRPIEERRGLLADLEAAPPLVPAGVVDDGTALWEFVESAGVEGMVAKRAGSSYRQGARSPDWRKVARVIAARAVVGGFTAGEGGRGGTFGSLLVGQWTATGLRWCGAVGTGFDDAALRRIRAGLDEMRRDDSPFLAHPDLPAAVWVEPQLVVLVHFKEWTDAGRMRAPVFVGFTGDDPVKVRWEEEGP